MWILCDVIVSLISGLLLYALGEINSYHPYLGFSTAILVVNQIIAIAIIVLSLMIKAKRLRNTVIRALLIPISLVGYIMIGAYSGLHLYIYSLMPGQYSLQNNASGLIYVIFLGIVASTIFLVVLIRTIVVAIKKGIQKHDAREQSTC